MKRHEILDRAIAGVEKEFSIWGKSGLRRAREIALREGKPVLP